MAEDGSDRGHRGIGLLGAMAIGIGGMVGGGIFAVLGEAIALAHGATPVAFAVGGLVALLTAWSYTRLTLRFPSQGGTVTFVDKAFGSGLLTGSLNALLWLSYLVTMSMYAVAFGDYGRTVFGPSAPWWVLHALVTFAIVLPVLLNLLDASIVGESETLIVVLKLAMLAIVIGSGFLSVDGGRVAPSTWGDPWSIVAAGMVVFVAYEGFELIANAAGDMRQPKKTIPWAYFGSVGLVVGLYVAVAVVTLGNVAESRIAQVQEYALAEAARPNLGQFGFYLVVGSALLATFSAINATIYGSARLGFSLARDRELPEILAKKAWNEPLGVLVVGALTLLVANLVPLRSISILASAGFLLVFAVVNAAAWRLASDTGGGRTLPALGTFACAGALATLLVKTGHDDPTSLGAFSAAIAACFVFELLYGRARGWITGLEEWVRD